MRLKSKEKPRPVNTLFPNRCLLGHHVPTGMPIRPKLMKHSQSILIGTLAMAAIQFASTGCVADGGGGGGGDVYYGGDPWVQTDVVVTGGGRGWYGGRNDGHGDRGYVHPSAPRPAARSAPAPHNAPAHVDVRAGGNGREGDKEHH